MARPLPRPLCFLKLLVLASVLVMVLSSMPLTSRKPQGGRRHRLTAYDWDYEEEVEEKESKLRALLDWVLRKKEPKEPHPMRMERWAIVMQRFPFGRLERCMEFHRDGTCEVLPSEKERGREKASILGKWRYDKYGLNWELVEGGITHYYHAELIWHSFGERPKMHCGVCVRDRSPKSFLPQWLWRPVVATFHGYGNGTDTYTAEGFSETRFDNF